MDWETCKRWNKKEFEGAWDAAQRSGLPGKLKKVNHPWQLFTYHEDGICIVFYPYKCPSAGGHTVRIRDQGSKNPTRLKEIILTFEEGDTGYYFSSKWKYVRAGIDERIRFKETMK